MSSSYAEDLGARLRAVRRGLGMSLQDVERRSGGVFRIAALGTYERGERAISVARLHRLARLYGVAIDQLIPPDAPAGNAGSVAADRPIDVRQADRVTVDLTRLHEVDGPDVDLLSRYLGMIQVQRQGPPTSSLTIRSEDVVAIAYLCDTTPTVLRRRLAELRPAPSRG